VIDYMKARELVNQKRELRNGSSVSVVIWELSERSKERPHGFKYRLNYWLAGGITLVRYDNKRGKGDHRHVAGRQERYEFRDIETLLNDFWNDVDEILEKGQYE
jgi:hypothetical protein